MTAPITATKLDQAIAELNADRELYGWDALEGIEAVEAVEGKACLNVAEYWVGQRLNLNDWRQRLVEMVELFRGEISYRTHRIDLCGVVDTWEEDFGLDRDSFLRLQGKIEQEIKHCSNVKRYFKNHRVAH